MSETVNTVQLQQLMERIRGGDRAARDELLRSVARRLEALARHMMRRFPRVGRWAEVDDVLQNASLRILRALDEVEFGSTRDFFGLAATQLRRELLDMARRFDGPHNDAAHHESGSQLDVQDLSVSNLSLNEWSLFHEAVDKLPTQEREVVSLVFYHEWTQPQVAELFQVDVRTVKRWWRSAILKLGQALKPASSS